MAEEEPKEKCFVDYEKALTEDLKEHIKENCSKLEKCFSDIKEQKQDFDSLKAKLVEYDEYIELLITVRPPPEGFVNPSNYKFMDTLANEPQTLDDVYNLSHYYYGASDGTVTTAPAYRADPEIQKALDSGQYNKEYPATINDSAQWMIDTIETAKSSPEVFFGATENAYYGSEQEQKLNELKDIIRKIDVIIGGAGEADTNVSKKCAKEIWKTEQKQKTIAGDEIDLGLIGSGEIGDLSGEEKDQALENLINEVGEGTGDDVDILGDIPIEFNEQCALLALIYQLSELHQIEEALGSGVAPEGGSSDPMDFTSAMRAYSRARVKRLPYEAGTSNPIAGEGATAGGNSTLVVDGQPYGFINKLTQYGSMVSFFEATNAQLAHLQPTIRLFKVSPVDKGEVETEFYFDTFAREDDVDSILSRSDKRGFGVGLQNFRFKYDGSNPFSVKKSIKASLSITANNFSELLDDSRGFRYIDLALKTGKLPKVKFSEGSDKAKELDFRIKAIVGLSIPDGKTTAEFDSIKRAVENNYVTLNLTPVTHTFDFDDTGAVKFNIEYYAYIEEYFDKARMNIFADPEINKRVITRQLGIKTQKKNCKDEDLTKLNEFIEKDGIQVKKDKIQSLQFLTTEMLANNLIYYLNLSTEDFKKLSTLGPFFDIADIKEKVTVDGKVTAESISADLEEAFNAKIEQAKDSEGLKNSFKISGIDNRQIPFFFLGDLLDIILEKIGMNLDNLTASAQGAGLPEKYVSPDGGAELDIDPELLTEEKIILANSVTQFKKFRLVLGPVEIVNHRSPAQVSRVSLSDIPISLAYFNEWLTSKLLAKDSANYPLTQFVSDLINNLIRDYLNDDSCYNFNIKQKTRLFQSVVTSYRQAGQQHDDITNKIINSNSDSLSKRLNIDKVSEDDKPVLNIGGHRRLAPSNLGTDKENNFFIFYAGRTAPPDLLTGDRTKDQDNGVFHYIMGRDRGIVKTIKLNKTDSPGLKEVRFEQEGYQGLYQLREIYDVNIETFCNVHAFPGTYIFVEPQGFSPALGKFDQKEFDLTDLGIGGYYMIISSEHDFGPGKMNTSITAKWVQSLDATEEEKQKQYSSTAGSGESQVKKCGVR